MKKIILALFVLISSVCIFANDVAIFNDFPGNYALYEDSRFEEKAIIGLCYVGDNSIIARSYEPKTENELVILMNFVIGDNGIEPGNNLRILKGDFNSSENAKRLLPMIMNWSVSWYTSKAVINEKGSYSYSSDDDFNYLSYIPVFQIDSIGDDNKFKIFSMGKVNDLNDERFFNLNAMPEAVDAESYKITKGKKTDVTIDGLKIPLDSNWKTTDERIYRLDKVTPQDAAFLVETFNYKESGFNSLKELANLLLVANQNVILLAEGSKVVESEGAVFITCRMYDPVQKKITYQETQLIERNDGYVSVATLACYETLYLKNKKYFDSIMH
ncbi:MAG: hypothetical protein MJ176_07165 [Treponema sp.]|nr:hypothetical protein [Treponema sp.]